VPCRLRGELIADSAGCARYDGQLFRGGCIHIKGTRGLDCWRRWDRTTKQLREGCETDLRPDALK
jgi:hypothetical protein